MLKFWPVALRVDETVRVAELVAPGLSVTMAGLRVTLTGLRVKLVPNTKAERVMLPLKPLRLVS